MESNAVDKVDDFEEQVCAQRIASCLTGALILCLQMRSAFWRGATLLEKSESSVDQHRKPTSDMPRDTEGLNEIPKNVVLLESAMGKLMDKVAHKALMSLILPG